MKKYDIAISFAGEHRKLVDFVAKGLQEFDVFYDVFEQHVLWGSDLTVALPQKYINARYCLVFISEEYLNKMWTTLERQTIISEFLKRKGHDYVLPVRVDGFKGSVPGLTDLTGYLDIASNEGQKLIDLIKLKLEAPLKDGSVQKSVSFQ